MPNIFPKVVVVDLVMYHGRSRIRKKWSLNKQKLGCGPLRIQVSKVQNPVDIPLNPGCLIGILIMAYYKLLQSPNNWVGFHPLYTTINQGFGHCSSDHHLIVDFPCNWFPQRFSPVRITSSKDPSSKACNICFSILAIRGRPWKLENLGHDFYKNITNLQVGNILQHGWGVIYKDIHGLRACMFLHIY